MVVLLIPALHLGQADANVPFRYKQDGLFFGMTVKTVIEQGWYEHNDRLGAPFGLDLHDFAALGGNNLDYVAIKAFGLFSGDYAVVENAYYLLTFVLIAIAALLVLRAIGVSTLAAGVAAVLYAFAPYHLLRGENHLMLSAYYSVPLACWLALMILDGDPLFFSVPPSDDARPRFNRRRAALMVLACVVIGSSSGSAYYAAFASLLIAVAAGVSYLWHRNARVLLSGIEAALLILVVVTVNLSPALAYRAKHGVNAEVAKRGAPESENFGLKIAQMVLPVEGHRLKPLADLRAKYSAFPPRTEADASTLGTAGTIGFGWLVIVAFGAIGWPQSRERRRERHLSAAALGLVLLATVGGGATLIALLLTTQIRAWNRVSIFVLFLALGAIALLLDRLRPRFGSRQRVGMAAVAVVVVVVGVADQVSPAVLPPYDQIRNEYRSDHRFVEGLERRLPRGAAIFQLPYIAFPEPPPTAGVETNYDHLRGFLHSRHLRWSAAAMKDRPADWSAAQMTKPLEVVLPAVVAAGFAGVWIDRRAYGPAADTVQHQVEGIVGERADTSGDAHFAFFDLRRFAADERTRLGPERITILRDATLHPVTIKYSDGFGLLESDLTDNWRWAEAHARVVLHNPKRTPQSATVTIPVAAGTAGEFHLEVLRPGGPPERHTIHQERSSVRFRVIVPPGDSSIRLITDTPPRPVAPSEVVIPGRIRVFPVDVTTDAMERALAGP
jgi:phosphoglycerol transferase